MRQVTKEIVRAFLSDSNKRISNSEVVSNGEFTKLYLFNNLIARKNKSTGVIEISMAGYPSLTTRERLNGLPGVNLYQRKGMQYLNGVVIDTNKFYQV